MANDDIYVFGEDEATRISRAVRKSEEPEPVVASTRMPRARGGQFIRAVLCEDLYGHESALALKCERVVAYQMQDVQIVGGVGLVDNGPSGFRLKLSGLESNLISATADADEFLAALAPWTFAGPGDIYVTGGRVAPELVPPNLPQIARPEVLYRWTVAFVGSQFDNQQVSRIEISYENLGGGLIVTFQSAWQVTDEVIQVFEGGLIPEGPVNFTSPPPHRTPLVAGAAVLCGWCDDAEGYVVCSAEARKFWIR